MELSKFIVEAKLNTYAKSGEGGERILSGGGKELVYERNGWKYRDCYFGFKQFAGQEVVWQNDRVVWVMNYYGGVDDRLPAQAVYAFLKQALLKVVTAQPYRGPEKLMAGDFCYSNTSTGTVENFMGTEIISYRGRSVYKLVYHGGNVA